MRPRSPGLVRHGALQRPEPPPEPRRSRPCLGTRLTAQPRPRPEIAVPGSEITVENPALVAAPVSAASSEPGRRQRWQAGSPHSTSVAVRGDRASWRRRWLRTQSRAWAGPRLTTTWRRSQEHPESPFQSQQPAPATSDRGEQPSVRRGSSIWVIMASMGELRGSRRRPRAFYDGSADSTSTSGKETRTARPPVAKEREGIGLLRMRTAGTLSRLRPERKVHP